MERERFLGLFCDSFGLGVVLAVGHLSCFERFVAVSVRHIVNCDCVEGGWFGIND